MSARLFKKVHSVQLKSFSIANKLFVVLEGDNELELGTFNYSQVTVAPNASPSVTSHTKVVVEFPLELYTIHELVDYFNEDIAESKHTSDINIIAISMIPLAIMPNMLHNLLRTQYDTLLSTYQISINLKRMLLVDCDSR